VCSRDFLIRISADGGRFGGGRAAGGMRRGRRRRGVVGLEDVEALQLLVEDGEGLELLRLGHLHLEPRLDLVLLLLDQVLVVVVEVSVED
jgi:hypothetical protein